LSRFFFKLLLKKIILLQTKKFTEGNRVKKIAKLLVLTLIISMCFPALVNINQSQYNVLPNKAESALNIKSDPAIFIDGNKQLNNTATAGNGTMEFPWILENYTICISSGTPGIRIENTNEYFILRNCRIYDLASDGIQFTNVTNFNLRNCTIYNTTNYGINFEDVRNFNLEQCSVSDCYGIKFDDVSNCNFQNCTIYNTLSDGIYLFYVTNVAINDTVINSCNFGIRVSDSNKVNITHCNIYNSTADGIYITDSHDNVIANNSLCENQNGIFIEDSDRNHLSYNIANNNDYEGIWYTGTTGSYNTTITHNTANQNGQDGFNLIKLHNATITYNTANNNVQLGISLCGTYNSTVSYNTAQNNKWGIWLSSSSSFNIITWNDLQSNSQGCWKEATDCIGNTIENNDCGGGIPGYSLLFLLIGLISVVSLTIARKQRTKQIFS